MQETYHDHQGHFFCVFRIKVWEQTRVLKKQQQKKQKKKQNKNKQKQKKKKKINK